MVDINHLREQEFSLMSDAEQEIMKIFEELSPDNQHTLLMYARVAYIAEDSIKKSITRALEGKCGEKF